MGTQRKTAFAQYPLYPVHFHDSLPLLANHIGIARQADATTPAHAERVDDPATNKPHPSFTGTDDPVRAFFIAFNLLR